ncbi:tetratricopeptide repeat protein [Iodobacter sp. LRB]|uniref:tetratricopeptide repeat protein n=1 Tax=unclassified Iodobacter TaxID=235634 RepID=UPI000C1020CF|nr:tetratricopeptide repeat protein [Iodobacter sp. BJB302]PHV02970.1 hypothetical protein CSQ88_04195 [Iodobacter sp. BJB302]
MNIVTARKLRAEGRHYEAGDILVELAVRSATDTEVQFEAACVHDYLGEEAAAVPYYCAAIAGGLSDEHLRSAFLGLGSTYRTLGRFAEAEATLRQGLERFPDANEMKVFLSMALHNLGRSKLAVETLLALLAQTSNDGYIQAYQEAIAFYSQDIERTWPT